MTIARKACSILAIAAATVPLGNAAHANVSEPGRYEGYSTAYPDVVRTRQHVDVGDGRLAVTILRPARDGVPVAEPLPTVVFHFRPSDREYAVEYAKAGYVVAWIQQRGTGASFGPQIGFVTHQNGQDVQRVMEWAAKQPWSDGNFVMAGGSHGGYIQWMTALRSVPGLHAITPSVATARLYSVVFTNGVSGMGGPGQPGAQPRDGLRHAPLGESDPVDTDTAPDFPLLAEARASQAGNLSLPEEWLVNMHRDAVNPRIGYAPALRTPSEYPEHIAASGVKSYIMTGWLDTSPGFQIVDYRQFGSKLLVGDWAHEVENPMQRAERLRWFDRWAKGVDNGVDREPPVYYRTINADAGEEWNFAAQFPLPSEVRTRFFMDEGPSGTVASINDGSLGTARPASPAASDDYRADYEAAAFDGKFVRLDRRWTGDMTSGIDERALTYTTPVLEQDTEVTGFPIVSLWVTSTANDGDFVAWLEDIQPDGRSQFVTDGMIRGSHRKITPNAIYDTVGIPYHSSLQADSAPLPQNEPTELLFDLTPTSYVFKAGHRIRVSITAGERDTYQLPEGMDRTNPPTISLFRSSTHSSYIELPVIPRGSKKFTGAASRKGTNGFDGRADAYVSAERIYIRLGSRWLQCSASGSANVWQCDDGIGDVQLKHSVEGLRIESENLRFDGIAGER